MKNILRPILDNEFLNESSRVGVRVEVATTALTTTTTVTSDKNEKNKKSLQGA